MKCKLTTNATNKAAEINKKVDVSLYKSTNDDDDDLVYLTGTIVGFNPIAECLVDI